MAFTQSSLVDLLFKRLLFNVSNTKPVGVITAYNDFFNEPYPSFPSLKSNQVWLQSDQIPQTATSSSVTQLFNVQLSPVTGAITSGVTFSFYDPQSQVIDVIPPTFDTTYAVKIYKGDGVTEISSLNNGGAGDFIFDTNNGVLTFYSPSSLTGGNSLGGNPYVRGYKYIGKKGVVPNLNGLTYSSGTMSINIGSGLTFSNGQLITTSGLLSAGQGMTLSGNTFSLSISTNGLTFSSNSLTINIGSGLTFSSGQLQTLVTTVSGNGLTNSGNTFSVLLSQNSGLTVSSSGLGLSTNINGTGLTFTNGQLSLSNPIYFSNGITNSGNTYSVNINSNGLTFSNTQVSLNIGSGLTFSSGRLQTLLTAASGNGLTNSGNTFSILLDPTTPGLTVSSSGLKILSSLIVVTSSVTLGTNVIGQYTTDPTTNGAWSALSIPTRSYVDSIATGLNLKQAVRVAATGSVTISSAPVQIDGVTLSNNDRVLLWRQDGTINGTNSNGIYIYNGSGSPMTRATDFDGAPLSEVTTGAYTFVTEGTTYQGAGFVVVAIGTATGQILVGTQSMRWTQFNGSPAYQWNNGLISSGLNIDVDLANNSGLTFSSGQLLISLPTNSGLQLTSNGLSMASNINGTGLTFSNGQISLSNPIYFGNGITSSGNTYSVSINTNGLTFSNNQLSLNLGNGLTFSNGQITNSATINVGNGLTSSGNTYSVLIGEGLTFSNNQISFGLTGTQNEIAFWGTTTSILSTSKLTWNNTNKVLTFSDAQGSQIYPIVLENTTSGGGPSSGSVGIKLKSGSGAAPTFSGTASVYFTKSNGGGRNDNSLNFDLPDSALTIYANYQNGRGNNFEIYSDNGGGDSSIYFKRLIGTNPRAEFVLKDDNSGTGRSEFTINQGNGNLTKLKGYTTYGSLGYGSASNVISFTSQNIYLGSYSIVPTSSVIVEIAPGTSNLIPFKLNAGTLATTKQDGGIEYDGSHAYITIGSTRYQLDNYNLGDGLTQSGGTMSVVVGLGLQISNNQLQTKVNTSTGLYNAGGTNYINWSQILGAGLTWSGSLLNTTSSLLQKYSTTLTFTASQAQTITHALNTSDFVIQIYDSSTGDEVLAQYTSRTTSQITVTTFDNVTGRVVIIG